MWFPPCRILASAYVLFHVGTSDIGIGLRRNLFVDWGLSTPKTKPPRSGLYQPRHTGCRMSEYHVNRPTCTPDTVS